MKKINPTVLLLLLFGLMTATVARADHWHHGGAHFGVGVIVDPWPLAFPYATYPYSYYPYGYYPYSYSPPVVVTQQAAPTTYVEQGAPVQGDTPSRQAAPSNDWYYCRNPEGYYPYVRACPDGWQRVPSQPPAQH